MSGYGVPQSESSTQPSKSSLDERLKALEAKASTYATSLKIALAVAGIFGISGGFGLKMVSDAHEQLRQLQNEVASAKDTVRGLTDFEHNPDIIKAAKTAAQDAAEKESQQITRDKLDPLINKLRLAEHTNLYDLVRNNGCYFYLESDVHSGTSGNTPFRLGMEKDRSLRAVVGAQAIAGDTVPKWRFAISGSGERQDCAHP